MSREIFSDKEAGDILNSNPKFKKSFSAWVLRVKDEHLETMISQIPEPVRLSVDSMVRINLSNGTRDLYDFFDVKGIHVNCYRTYDHDDGRLFYYTGEVIVVSEDPTKLMVIREPGSWERPEYAYHASIIEEATRGDIEKDLFLWAINHFENV